jgi:predicted PurR-regulated permease PerM
MVVPQALEGLRRLSSWWLSGHPIPPAISYYLGEAHRLFVENIPDSAEYLDKLENDVATLANTIIKDLLTRGVNLAGDTMGIVWALFLFVVFTCLIVVYAPVIRRTVLQVFPQYEKMVDRFSLVLHNASRSVFIGIVFVPIIQGTLTGFGLRFLNVPDPAFWGLLSVFAAVVPMAGTALVWLPIAIYLWATQSLGSALLLVAWGTIVVSGSDNLLRPYFLKTGIEASMVVLLLSIICSLAVFGAVGLIAGPVLVAVASQAMKESELLSNIQK